MVKVAPNSVDAHIGARIRLRRLLLNMSQEKLGDHLGVTFQQVQKYEKGTNRISASRLRQISELLDVPVAYFYPEGSEELALKSSFAEPASSWGSMDLPQSPDSIQLLKSFSQIKDAKLRKKVIDLVKAIAESEDEPVEKQAL